MAALHDALKTLGAVDYTQTPTDDLKPFLEEAFTYGQTIVDSIPISDKAEATTSRPRSGTTSSIASSASEITISDARSPSPPPEVEALRKEWKQVKLKPADNPLGISVYSTKGKDGKGTWFARRSVHEGLGFTKWKRALEREFPETLKVQGGPGEGNIRGIGGERRVAYNYVGGTGKMEVYLLSAQFPGPTTPRDFVTMFISSDQALKEQGNGEVPRHFMVISRPCQHPDAPPREGYIRGHYESVEFIREIPIKKAPPKSTSPQSRNRSESSLGREAVLRNAKNHNHDPSRASEEADIPVNEEHNGATTQGDGMTLPSEEDESEQNPIEWIMVTRSDPGGSVPRFMIDRGTPAAIVSDAGKFLDWACSKSIEELDSDGEEPDETDPADEDQQLEHPHHHHREHNHETDLHNYQTNGHLVGTDYNPDQAKASPQDGNENEGGIYEMVADAATTAGAVISAHVPAVIADRLPQTSESSSTPETTRERSQSVSSISTQSTVDSFTSARSFARTSTNHTIGDSAVDQKFSIQHDKELQKLEERKRKLNEKLERAKQKEAEKKMEDGEKEKEALRKVEEKHEREVKRQEEKYRKEMEKLERKREKEEAKRRRKEEKDKDEGVARENEALRAELEVLKREREVLKTQVGNVQRENTLLVGRIGKLGGPGEEMLREVRDELMRGGAKGRKRAGSGRGGSFSSARSAGGSEIGV
ncbi:START-like domain protein [Rutstroemia sp. NJR-2017a BBW]|nr:START-like domain protein [Rutstroemia sp. NJR-2017a BBW]